MFALGTAQRAASWKSFLWADSALLSICQTLSVLPYSLYLNATRHYSYSGVLLERTHELSVLPSLRNIG